MSPWLVPVTIEACAFLLFAAVLVCLRRLLTWRSLSFWLALWFARAGATLAGFRFLAAAREATLFVYAPLQVAFALAVVLIAYRIERQRDELRRLNDELERLRREAGQIDTDAATGLMSRSALARWMEDPTGFEGVAVVADLDDFKALNDRYGHLVGDEILRGLGQLLRSSIRQEDSAFRWGGDEFVILFHNLDAEVVRTRMRGLEERLQKFQIRNHGPIAVSLSWGVAPTAGRPLIESVAEADRAMYEFKRDRRSKRQSAGTA